MSSTRCTCIGEVTVHDGMGRYDIEVPDPECPHPLHQPDDEGNDE